MPENSPAAKLNALTLAHNIPAAVTIELTRRCPLSCAHCYLPETRGRAAPARELTTARWKAVLAQLAEAGALYLVFTGGEPLLRPDLAELCRYARKLNFDVRVYSTGLGLTPALAGELKRAGVSAFELSFYGRPAAHDAVTGVEGSFAGSLRSARLLKANGMKVKFKTPLMKNNLAQAGWLKALAAREGFSISFDPVITGANDGESSALDLRLSGAQLQKAVKLYGAAPTFPVHEAALSAAKEPSSFDFLCGAGRNVCAVSPGGDLFPCLQLPVTLGNLAGGKFPAIWKSSPWLKKWRSAGAAGLKKCVACADLEFCSRCPGVSFQEEGDVFAPNAPACALAGAARKLAKRVYRK